MSLCWLTLGLQLPSLRCAAPLTCSLSGAGLDKPPTEKVCRSLHSGIHLTVNLSEEVAQIYQQDGQDLQSAMDAYEKSGEWYASEDATACVTLLAGLSLTLTARNSMANGMFKESADLAAQLGHYQKAIQRYEQVRAYSNRALCAKIRTSRLPQPVSPAL